MPHALIAHYQKRAWELQWPTHAYPKVLDRLAQLQAEEADRVEVEHPLALSNMPLTRLVWIRNMGFEYGHVYDAERDGVRYCVHRTWTAEGYRWKAEGLFKIGECYHEAQTKDYNTFGGAEINIAIHVSRLLAGELVNRQIDNLTREAPR